MWWTAGLDCVQYELSVSFSVAIFPREPRLAGFIGAKVDGGGGDSWSYKTCIAPAGMPTVMIWA